MAGLGFKDFQVGEVLTSSDVDGYLMAQSVMRFADAGARGSALGTAPGTAVALTEGMTSYLNDVNRIEVYNGSSWLSVGLFSQVVASVKTDTFTTTSTSWTDITGLTATITPSSSANKVLIVAQVSANLSDTTDSGRLKIAGGNTGAYIGDTASSRPRAVVGGWSAQSSSMWTYTMVYLDSPATTSATTYSAQAQVSSGVTLYVNRSVLDTDGGQGPRGASSITVLEVNA